MTQSINSDERFGIGIVLLRLLSLKEYLPFDKGFPRIGIEEGVRGGGRNHSLSYLNQTDALEEVGFQDFGQRSIGNQKYALERL